MLSKLCVTTAQSKICKVGSFRVFFPPCRFETLYVGACSGAGVRRKLWNFSKRRKSLVESGLLGWRRCIWRGAWHCSKPDSGSNRSRENWSRTCTCVNAAQHGLELDLRDSIFLSKTRLRSISVPHDQALSPDKHKTKCNGQLMFSTTDLVYLSLYFIYSLFCLFTGCMCETSA